MRVLAGNYVFIVQLLHSCMIRKQLIANILITTQCQYLAYDSNNNIIIIVTCIMRCSIQINSLTMPVSSSSLSTSAGEGLTLQASDISVSMTADWSYELHSLYVNHNMSWLIAWHNSNINILY